MIRVVLPAHLRQLAQVSGEVQFDLTGQVTQRLVLDALEEPGHKRRTAQSGETSGRPETGRGDVGAGGRTRTADLALMRRSL